MAGSLDVQVHMSPQFRDMLGRFARAQTIVDQALEKMAQDFGRDALVSLRDATPVKSGAARESWRVDLQPSKKSVVITNKKPYLPFLISGTRPHDIRPKTPGGVLRWLDAGGDPVFARGLVHHPGTRPNPALVQAVERLEHTAAVDLHDAGVEVIQKLAGS